MEAGKLTIDDMESPDPGKKAKLVILEGSIDENSVDKLSREIYGAINANPANLYLLIDLEKVDYLNSKTIGYLTDWYGKVTQGGGKLVIAKPGENIMNILDSVGLAELIPICHDIEEARTKLFE